MQFLYLRFEKVRQRVVENFEKIRETIEQSRLFEIHQLQRMDIVHV